MEAIFHFSYNRCFVDMTADKDNLIHPVTPLLVPFLHNLLFSGMGQSAGGLISKIRSNCC